MSERPPPVRLDDLRSPRFSPAVEQLRAAMAELAPSCPLDPEALCSAATAETGLHDFGDPRFADRLEVLCGALRGEARLHGPGVVTWYAQILGFLKNRLLIEDLLARHPEIHDVVIERPIIIAGLPRTGTTHLHNLISADPALRSLPYWESLEPVLAEAERPAPGQPDPRLERTALALQVLDDTMPYFKRMHEMTLEHVHEEIQLMAIDLSTMLFESEALIPAWRDHFMAEDQTPTYDYLKTVLKVLQFLRGGRRWVLKSPQHLEQFGPLITTFPDATVVVTHRDPAAVTVSVATMIGYSLRMSTDDIDPLEVGRYWSARGQDLFSACLADRDLLPADQSLDVLFHEFMADDVATVKHIYDVAGQPFTEEARAAMSAFVAAHPRGRHGTVVYEPETFGIDRAERQTALRDYVDRFGIELEAPDGHRPA